jgi:hypothetical protein
MAVVLETPANAGKPVACLTDCAPASIVPPGRTATPTKASRPQRPLPVGKTPRVARQKIRRSYAIVSGLR